MSLTVYPPHQPQLQHAAVSQAPQPIQNGHPGQPTPHAMQHLHPGGAVFQHQQQMQALANSMNNPQLFQQQQQQQQQQRILRQQQHQMLLAANGLSGAGNPGVPGNPQNPGMGAFAGPPQMRAPMLPQHVQQIQAQQAQIHQQQQHIVAAQAAQAAQQLALANQGVNVQAAAQNMSMPQQQVTIPANAAAVGGPAQQQVNLAVAHAAAVVRAQQHQQNKPSGQAVLKMHYFNSMLCQFEKDKAVNSIMHWRKFVADFFSASGLMRQALWHQTNRESKHFEIGNAILPRYFWELIESGVNSVQFQLEGLREKELPNGQGMVVECQKAGLVYTYKDAVCFHHGSLRATLNSALQIEVLEFSVLRHQEFVSRSTLQLLSNPSESPDVKASPRTKQLGKRPLLQEQPVQGYTLPEGHTNQYGLHPTVLRFLETAETMSCLGELMFFSRQNPQLTPRDALNALVNQFQAQQLQQQQQMAQQAAAAVANAQGMQNHQQGHPGGPNGGAGGPHMHNSPHMGMVPGMVGSPAVGEGRLVTPSPHIGQTPSPANQLQAPGQQPQQHPISNSSSQNSTTVGSANTSPNQPNKRRRPSTSQNVKNETEDGNETKNNAPNNLAVKPSPRMANNKRIKTANAS